MSPPIEYFYYYLHNVNDITIGARIYTATARNLFSFTATTTLPGSGGGGGCGGVVAAVV